jgi:choline dehydrogenase-like flavoprotein
MEGAAALGASGGPISRNAGSCVQCSSCPYGCRIDAKRGMHVSYLPRAVAAGARLRAGVEAQRVIVEGGRAVGVRCAGYEVRARRTTIVAGGAFGTPELLLRSGLGGKQVGRNLHIHPACWVGARYEEEVRGWEGVMQSYYVDQWKRQGLLLEATFTPLPFGGAWLRGTGRRHQEAILDFGHVGSIGVHLSDESCGRVGTDASGSLRVRYGLSRDDARRLGFGIARAAEIHFAAGAVEVYPNIARVPVLRPGELAAFEATAFKPAELRLEAFHPMGTARIAADPSEGVCAADGSVNGVGDLHVADASLFPTSVGVNPMMTVIAFAKRVAAGVAEATPAA